MSNFDSEKNAATNKNKSKIKLGEREIKRDAEKTQRKTTSGRET